MRIHVFCLKGIQPELTSCETECIGRIAYISHIVAIAMSKSHRMFQGLDCYLLQIGRFRFNWNDDVIPVNRIGVAESTEKHRIFGLITGMADRVSFLLFIIADQKSPFERADALIALRLRQRLPGDDRHTPVDARPDFLPCLFFQGFEFFSTRGGNSPFQDCVEDVKFVSEVAVCRRLFTVMTEMSRKPAIS